MSIYTFLLLILKKLRTCQQNVISWMLSAWINRERLPNML